MKKKISQYDNFEEYFKESKKGIIKIFGNGPEDELKEVALYLWNMFHKDKKENYYNLTPKK